MWIYVTATQHICNAIKSNLYIDNIVFHNGVERSFSNCWANSTILPTLWKRLINWCCIGLVRHVFCVLYHCEINDTASIVIVFNVSLKKNNQHEFLIPCLERFPHGVSVMQQGLSQNSSVWNASYISYMLISSLELTSNTSECSDTSCTDTYCER